MVLADLSDFNGIGIACLHPERTQHVPVVHMPDKVDIHLEISDTAHDVESSIKAGQVVLLKVDDESSALVCCTNSGTQLGAVPATYRDRIKRPAEAHATIRSVKRQADKVTDILVRVVLGSPASVSGADQSKCVLFLFQSSQA